MIYRLYEFIDKTTLEFDYESSDLNFLKKMRKTLMIKYNSNYLIVEVVL